MLDATATAHDAKPRQRPPAPKPRERPFGTLGFLAAIRRNPIETWTKLHFEKPIVVGETIMGRIATVSDPEAIKRIFVDNAANYRKDALQLRVLSPGLGLGLLTAQGDAWRQQRRALAPMFTPRTVHSFIPAMQASADKLAARLERRRDGRVIDVGQEMGRVTLDVLERTIFSSGLERNPQDFADNLTRYFDSVGKIDPLDILGMPKWVPRLGRMRGRGPLEFFTRAVDAIMMTRRKRLEEDPASLPRDLLTLLMEARDPETGEGLSEVEIRANVITFIGAGHETTANALTWTLFLLGGDPEVRAVVEAEADRELANGPITSATIERLVATRAVIEEAMRLYPPVSSLSREALEADDVGGVRIRAGSVVVVSPWVLHRHRLLWEEPEHFAPWRFLPENRGKIHRFAYLPFGAGPRVCIGASFSLQEAVIVLATIMRQFRLDPVPNHAVVPVQRITLRPKGGMPMVLRAR